jgi:membrane-bound inhibitor of C-type lysozyme
VVLSETYDSTKAATDISLPFKHNRSRLKYNEETKTYDYYEYGDVHKDAEDNEVLTFKNVFLQCSDFLQYDQNGYLIYDCIALTKPGYYITNGEAKLVYWSKGSETDVTRFYDENNEEIMINTGKTYISLVPSDTWDSITFE